MGHTEADVWPHLAEGLLPAEPKLLRVGDDNLCANSLGKEDEELADTMRLLGVALTSPAAVLRAARLRTVVIYLTESEFDPSELLIHPSSHTVAPAPPATAMTGVHAEDDDELELNYEENDSTMDVDTAHREAAEWVGANGRRCTMFPGRFRSPDTQLIRALEPPPHIVPMLLYSQPPDT
eukprot:jgi/Tetstr1/433061/TSEL_022396.t1